MDKRERNTLFRDRIIASMVNAGLNQSALARAIGCNRSTISQLLDDTHSRLPNAQLVAEIASALGVSVDWLLGLTDRPERPADIIEAASQISDAKRTAADEQMIDWHREADGFKVRHVPATLPDMLKTPEFLTWEYAALLGKTPEQAIANMEERLAWLKTTNSDYELALPKHRMQSLLRRTGYYEDCPADVVSAQARHFAEQCDALFPRVRVHFYDERKLFSAPLTVFGHLQAVLYIGDCYLTFRQTSRIKRITTHFDHLVKYADVQGREAADWIRSL